MFADVEMVNAAYQFCVIGAYLGMIIDAKKYRGTAKYAQDTSAAKTTLRLLITLAILIPVFTFCSIESQIYNKNPVKNGMVYRAFFLIAMPTLFLSLMFYGWGNLIFKKCKLIRERARQPKRSITTSDVDPMLNYEEVTDVNELGSDVLEFDQPTRMTDDALLEPIPLDLSQNTGSSAIKKNSLFDKNYKQKLNEYSNDQYCAPH